jgi:hypothetical protein
VRVLAVSEVRRHLYWTNGGAGAPGEGAPPTALLGQIFHDLYGALTGSDAQKNLAAPLELADASLGAWQSALIDHAFGAVVAAALARHERALQTHGAAVLEFWTAVRELCGWLAGVMHGERAADATRSLEAVRRLVFADTEVDLDVALTDPLWPEPVRLQGRVDALLCRHADAGRRLVELKLGRAHPQADLLQACLYHLVLAERSPPLAGAALGMISFEPQRREQLFEAGRLREAESTLKRLIGELVGFFPGRIAVELDGDGDGDGDVDNDVERPVRQTAAFADWRSQLPARSPAGSARFAIGVRVDGTLGSADLAASESPHLLVAGTTGSGKSEWLRAFLASLLAVNTPATLRLALIDPERLAFTALAHSPFLWEPVVHEDGAVALLDRLIEEMERRCGLLQSAGVDDVDRYQKLRGGTPSACPRLVCVCDEYADLILRNRTRRTAVEERVARIGAKGRAAGVHLVFATRRAGRAVLKGTIGAHLAARVALSMARKTHSRLVLGESGAETLLGRGDLLYKDIGAPVRMQGLYVTPEQLTTLGSGEAPEPR